MHRARMRAQLAAVLGAVGLAVVGVGCGSSARPVNVDVYVDTTFSNDQVAAGCLPDVLRSAEIAAASRGQFAFHTFDGDPLTRRSLSFDFGGMEIPRSLRGTSKEDDYLVKKVDEEVRPAIERQVAIRPRVGGTPLLSVLIQAARFKRDNRLKRGDNVLICTDGLFTDVTPHLSVGEARRLADKPGLRLDGATIDFIGLGVSAPGTGRWVEKVRPRVEGVVEETGGRMGVWEVDLPTGWPAPPEG